MKPTRRKVREAALQILFQLDVNPTLDVELAIEGFKACFEAPSEWDEFSDRLVRGVWTDRVAIDEWIKRTAENWKPERMPVVDRNILRLGVYELWRCDEIPATVSINEMVELAKVYGAENSPAFVNGILDRLRPSLVTPQKAP